MRIVKMQRSPAKKLLQKTNKYIKVTKKWKNESLKTKQKSIINRFSEDIDECDNSNNKKRKNVLKSKTVKLKCDKSDAKKSKMSAAKPSTSKLSRAKTYSKLVDHIADLIYDVNVMPTLVPFDSDGADESQIVCSVTETTDISGHLSPPILSPALDNNGVRNKRKSKVQLINNDALGEDEMRDLSVFSVKRKKENKCNNKGIGKKLKKVLDADFGDMFGKFNVLSKGKSNNKKKTKLCGNAFSSVWTISSDHTMTSAECANISTASSDAMDFKVSADMIPHISDDDSFVKPIAPPLKPKIKKEKIKVKSVDSFTQTFHPSNVDLPKGVTDIIEGMEFISFDTEDDLLLFTKIDDSKKGINGNDNKFGKFGKPKKIIVPTKTKDITKIKGWREKLFAMDDGVYKTKKKLSDSNIFSPLPPKLTPMTFCDLNYDGSSHKDSKSAFVSDILDGYLQNKSDFQLNHLNPDFEPPPEDSPIFSAGVLKMPDLHPNPTYAITSTPKDQRPKLGRPKGSMNSKDKSASDLFSSDSYNDFLTNYYSPPKSPTKPIHLIGPNDPLPIIRYTCWPNDQPYDDDYLQFVFSEYINDALNYQQMTKVSQTPSIIMDDHYARFALSALQCTDIPQNQTNPKKSNDKPLNIESNAAPEPKTPQSPLKGITKTPELKVKHRKDKDTDIGNIFAMNRSKRQIRLPTRFHESSLLMGNQWIIPDYEEKGKTGKRRLLEEQKRLQELHQRQLEMEQRNEIAQNERSGNVKNARKLSNELSLLTPQKKKKQIKSKLSPNTATSEYPLKVPQHRLKQIHIKGTKRIKSYASKGFTSLYSMAQQNTIGEKTISIKASESAFQRAHVKNMLIELYYSIKPERRSLHTKDKDIFPHKHVKMNKLQIINEAIETIAKLTKREQQLNYIKKLLIMWNKKLQVCAKVTQKEMKPEAIKIVNEVITAYRNSVCYKVEAALEAKRKEMEQKRLQQLMENSQETTSLIEKPIVSLNKSTKKAQLMSHHSSSPRFILPKIPGLKLPIMAKVPNDNQNNESVASTNSTDIINNSPTVVQMSPANGSCKSLLVPYKETVVTEDSKEHESSLLKTPILTTRPTVVKPFAINGETESSDKETRDSPPLSSAVSIQSIINVPQIPRFKSLVKPNGASLIQYPQYHLSMINAARNQSNSTILAHNLKYAATIKPKILKNSEDSQTMKSNSLNNETLIACEVNQMETLNPSVTKVASQKSSTHAIFATPGNSPKNVMIKSDTPLANEDFTKIVTFISAHPDNFSKVPIRLSNGLAALAVPAPMDMHGNGKLSQNLQTSGINQVYPMTTPLVTAAPSSSLSSHDSNQSNKQKTKKPRPSYWVPAPPTSTISSLISNASSKPNILQKSKFVSPLQIQSEIIVPDDVTLECDEIIVK